MRLCEIEGCKNKHYGRGYCIKHYTQLYNHGKILNRTIYDPNEFITDGNICRIKIYDKNGNEKAESIIDIDDIEKVKKYKWHTRKAKDGYRVATRINGKIVYLSNLIMNIKSNRFNMIDHKNHDLFNNTKNNLRKASASQNQHNSRISKNNSSGYKGVCWCKRDKKWKAYIRLNSKLINLGYYNDIKDAVRSFNEAAIKYHGEFACLNKI